MNVEVRRNMRAVQTGRRCRFYSQRDRDIIYTQVDARAPQASSAAGIKAQSVKITTEGDHGDASYALGIFNDEGFCSNPDFAFHKLLQSEPFRFLSAKIKAGRIM